MRGEGKKETGEGEGWVEERVKGGEPRARRRLARRERVNLGEARTETEHVKERRTEQEEGERQRKDGRGESIGESRELGLLHGGLTSPPLFLLLLFFPKLYVWNLTSFLS